jgi:hypothetical protein
VGVATTTKLTLEGDSVRCAGRGAQVTGSMDPGEQLGKTRLQVRSLPSVDALDDVRVDVHPENLIAGVRHAPGHAEAELPDSYDGDAVHHLPSSIGGRPDPHQMNL